MNQHPSPAAQAGPVTGADMLSVQARDVEENKDIAALSYVWVLSVPLYLFRRDSAFVRFHAKQGMLIFMLTTGFWFVPVAGRVLTLIALAYAAVGFVSAVRGEWRELPVIYALSSGHLSKLAFWHVARHRTGKSGSAGAQLQPREDDPSSTRSVPPIV